MTGSLQNPPETAETPLYGDAEIVVASGLALPSLRVLQSAGAIRAEKEAKEHGGFRRMWREDTVLKAAVGALMNEHFAWNIRTVAEVLAKSNPGVWELMTTMEVMPVSEMKPGHKLIKTSEQDWFLELIDRKFLFLRVPILMTAVLPNANWGQTDLLLGMVTPSGGFCRIPWYFGHKRGIAQAEEIIGNKDTEYVLRLYNLAMAVHANCLSKTSLNLGLQIRAAWRRLRGFEAHFVEAVLQPKKGEKKNERKSMPGRSPAAARKGGHAGNNR
jgi:hypothetical protein